MTLALTLLFALNLCRQLSHEEAQKPQNAHELNFIKSPYVLCLLCLLWLLCLFVAIRLTVIATVS